MAFRPAVLSYDDIRRRAEEFACVAGAHRRDRRVYVDAFVLQHRRRRYRFSMAHELAHHELHRRLDEESRVASVRDWRAVQDAISEEDYAWFEFQANSFAGLVLVPAVELRREFERAVKTARGAGLTGATLWSEAGKGYVARWLGSQFEASEQVIERRMEKDGLWPAPPAPVP